MASENPTLTLPVPIVLPSSDRIEELILQAALQAARERLMWLAMDEAAEYLGLSKRTLERKRKEIGLPASEMGGIIRICREDLDALLRAYMSHNGQVQLIVWPSGHPAPQGNLGVIVWPSLAKRADSEAGRAERRVA